MEELLNQVLLSQDSEVFNQIFDDYYPIDIALSLEALEDEEGNLLKTFTEMASDDQLVEILKEPSQSCNERLSNRFLSNVPALFFILCQMMMW